MRRVTAIVAARGGSVRLPRKALLPFGPDATLIARKVRQLRACSLVESVRVNTDDSEIAETALAAGALLIDGRDYANDTRRMLRHSAEQVAGDDILWAHPTNPLVDAETYDRAIRAYWAAECSSLLSVTPVRRHAWLDGRPLNHAPFADRHELAAELKPVLFQDGAIFISPRAVMEETGCFYQPDALLFELDPRVSVDIDTEADYRQALANLGGSHVHA